MKYRPEIDGLRALAVLPVILFHAGVYGFSGGFIGVDIFFVISGYLITRLMYDEQNDDRFSLALFYERRARRILPALLTVAIACLAPAWIWMTPDQLESFGASLLSISLFSSNVLFWAQDSYFGPAAQLKPLLHTWSLSVEEQFYLIYPILMPLLWRQLRKGALGVIIFLLVLSLTLSIWASTNFPSANFYLAPTRAWELLTGSVCALIGGRVQKRLGGIFAAVGLLLILGSFSALDESLPFPGVYAVPPVLGCALILLYGTSGSFVARILSQKPIVGVGLISYSAYLWHHPLLAFGRLSGVEDYGELVVPTLIGSSLILAYITWLLVERPFRSRLGMLSASPLTVLLVSAASLVLVGSLGLLIMLSDGARWRYSYATDFLDYFENAPPERKYFEKTGMAAVYRTECDFYMRGEHEGQTRNSIPSSCYTRTRGTRKAVFLWGDSHAQQYSHGLTRWLPRDWELLQVATSGCPPSVLGVGIGREICRRSNELALKAIAQQKPEVVLIAKAADWKEDEVAQLAKELFMRGANRVVVVGPAPRWRVELPLILVQLWKDLPNRTFRGLDKSVFTIDRDMREILRSKHPRVEYVSVLDVLCDASGCSTYFGSDAKSGITSWDSGHLTPIASDIVSQRTLVPAILNQSQN